MLSSCHIMLYIDNGKLLPVIILKLFYFLFRCPSVCPWLFFRFAGKNNVSRNTLTQFLKFDKSLILSVITYIGRCRKPTNNTAFSNRRLLILASALRSCFVPLLVIPLPSHLLSIVLSVLIRSFSYQCTR